MNRPELPPNLDIERLVRAHLEHRAEAIDPRPLFEKIQQSLAEPSPARVLPAGRAAALRAVWKWAGAAAAAILAVGGLTVLLHDRPALAKGETVVREARTAHLLPIDRCYLVEVRRESSLFAELGPASCPGPPDPPLDARRPVLGRVRPARTALGVGP